MFLPALPLLIALLYFDSHINKTLQPVIQQLEVAIVDL